MGGGEGTEEMVELRSEKSMWRKHLGRQWGIKDWSGKECMASTQV